MPDSLAPLFTDKGGGSNAERTFLVGTLTFLSDTDGTNNVTIDTVSYTNLPIVFATYGTQPTQVLCVMTPTGPIVIGRLITF